MIKEYIGEGTDLFEATAAAKEGLINTLGLKNDDDIKLEVISDFKKKTLGLFGGCMAQVKAFIELPDPKPEKKEKPAKKAEPKKAEPKKAEPKKVEKAEAAELTLIPEEKLEAGSSAAKAAAYIKSVMLGLGCTDVTVSAANVDGAIYLQLDGDKLGACIGRRGETLDALQYLTSLAANTGNGYQKVTLNIGNYREKREQTLTALAKKVAAQVLATGRSRALEPMNPYERRIIHTAIQEIDGVSSHSVGEGDRRHIVITPDNATPRAPKKTSAPVENREPKKDSEALPLYGKIK